MIDIRPVGHVLGWLVFTLGLLMIPCILTDLVDGNPNAREFALTAVLTIVTGAGMGVACAGSGALRLDLRQGFLLTTGSWFLFPVVASQPLILGDPHLSFTDAYFEMASAMTTSGGTVIVGLDHLARGTLLWRMVMSWVGGMGVILLALIILPVLNVGGMQLLRNADFNTLDKILPRSKDIAISIGIVYAVLTLACAVGFVWSGMGGFDAFTHAMSVMATSGMGNYDNSFARFSPAALWVATVFMLLGGMSFVRFVQLARGDAGALWRDSQIRAFLGIYAAFVAGLLVARALNGDTIDMTALRECAFNLASIITTTGLTSTDYGNWGPLAETLFFCAMMICACSGSTAGGPKVFRYQLLVQAIRGEVRRLHRPNVVFVPHFQGAPVADAVIDSVAAFFMLFFLTLGIGAVGLMLLGLDPVSAVSGAAASLSNVGPGIGPVIGPVGNYASLPDPAKWLCAFLMVAGRLELLTVYAIATTAFWRA